MADMIQQRCDTITVDGGSFDLHVWSPENGRGPGLLLLQEIFGVGPYISAVAERLAAAGYVVAAPDVFWRLHPRWISEHDEAGVQASMELVIQLDHKLAIADCCAALDHLRGLDQVDGNPGVLGFCLGGSLSFAVAAADDPALCVSYYGSTVPQMTDLLPAINCPTVLFFGDEDPFIPLEGVQALHTTLADNDRFTLHIEHAGHAFDNHRAPIFYNEAAAKIAWAKTMAFLDQHLPAAKRGAAS